MFLRVLKVVLCFTLFATIFAFAQTRAYINSKEITDNLIIDDEVFILAKSFADSIYAQYVYNPELGIMAINFNGHILTTNSNFIEIDNKRLAGHPIYDNDKLYLPLKSLAQAFGAKSYKNTEAGYLLLPRASLISSEMNSYSDYDRVILEFENLSPYRQVYNSELNTLELIFDNVYEQEFTVNYGSRIVMELGSSLGYLKLKLILSETDSYTIYNEASLNGHKLIIDSFLAKTQNKSNKKLLILLNQQEIETSQYFIDELSQVLELSDIELKVIGKESKNKADYLSDIFLAINVADISRNSINIYYQSSTNTNYLIRENATNALRRINTSDRQILLDKIANNYLFGQELAQKISDTIFNNIGYQSQVIAEDLSVVANYAGRGIILEISKDNLNNDLLINTLAQAIIQHLENYD